MYSTIHDCGQITVLIMKLMGTLPLSLCYELLYGICPGICNMILIPETIEVIIITDDYQTLCVHVDKQGWN